MKMTYRTARASAAAVVFVFVFSSALDAGILVAVGYGAVSSAIVYLVSSWFGKALDDD